MAEVKAAERVTVFSLPGGREMLTKARAEELVKPLLQLVESKAAVDRLTLSGKSFDAESAQVFGAAIAKLNSVRVADFSDVIAGRTKEVGLAALEALCSGLREQRAVEELMLSDNALGVEGVKACAAAVGQNVRRIFFNNNGLQGEAAGAIVDIVMRGEKKSQLESFEIFNNLLKDSGAKALAPLFAGSPGLRHLRFATTRLTPKGGQALANSLVDLRNLTHLDLSDNTLGQEAGQMLAKMLGQQKSLRSLNLGDTGIGKQGVASLCRALIASGAPLEVLELPLLEMDGKAASRHLAPLVAQKGKLLKLNVEGNEIHARGALALLTALEANTSLQELNLSSNRIGSKLKKKAKGKKGKEEEKNEGDVVQAVLRVLKNKAHLKPKSVRLSGNKLAKTDLATVAAALKAAGKHEALHVPEEGEEDEDEGDESSEGSGSGSDVESDMDQQEDKAQAKAAKRDKATEGDEVDKLAADLNAKAKVSD